MFQPFVWAEAEDGGGSGVGNGGDDIVIEFFRDADELVRFLVENPGDYVSSDKLELLKDIVGTHENRGKLYLKTKNRVCLKTEDSGKSWVEASCGGLASVGRWFQSFYQDMEVREVSAANFPHSESPKILISRSRWRSMDKKARTDLVHHELFGLIGLDYGYETLSLLTKPKPVLNVGEPQVGQVDGEYTLRQIAIQYRGLKHWLEYADFRKSYLLPELIKKEPVDSLIATIIHSRLNILVNNFRADSGQTYSELSDKSIAGDVRAQFSYGGSFGKLTKDGTYEFYTKAIPLSYLVVPGVIRSGGFYRLYYVVDTLKNIVFVNLLRCSDMEDFEACSPYDLTFNDGTEVSWLLYEKTETDKPSPLK